MDLLENIVVNKNLRISEEKSTKINEILFQVEFRNYYVTWEVQIIKLNEHNLNWYKIYIKNLI